MSASKIDKREGEGPGYSHFKVIGDDRARAHAASKIASGVIFALLGGAGVAWGVGRALNGEAGLIIATLGAVLFGIGCISLGSRFVQLPV